MCFACLAAHQLHCLAVQWHKVGQWHCIIIFMILRCPLWNRQITAVCLILIGALAFCTWPVNNCVCDFGDKFTLFLPPICGTVYHSMWRHWWTFLQRSPIDLSVYCILSVAFHLLGACSVTLLSFLTLKSNSFCGLFINFGSPSDCQLRWSLYERQQKVQFRWKTLLVCSLAFLQL